MRTYDHEAEVSRFFAQRAQDAPDWYREVCERYPVLSSRQLQRRGEKEIAISQFDSKEARRFFHDLFYSSAADSELNYDEESA